MGALPLHRVEDVETHFWGSSLSDIIDDPLSVHPHVTCPHPSTLPFPLPSLRVFWLCTWTCLAAVPRLSPRLSRLLLLFSRFSLAAVLLFPKCPP